MSGSTSTHTGTDWRAVALRTGPADRAAAEAGVRAAYRSAGLAEPCTVVWFDSPLQATAAALLLTGADAVVREAVVRDPATGAPADSADTGAGADAERVLAEAARILAGHGVAAEPGAAGGSVREALRTAPWEAARRRSLTALGPTDWSEHWSRTGGELWLRISDLTQRIRGAVADRLGGPDDPTRPVGPARSAVRLAMLDALCGQHDAAWLSALAEAPELDGLARTAAAAGWWWPYRDVVLLTERPIALHQDEPGRLHCADGPALAFPDGFALHAWRGMPVPAGFLDRLAALTAADIRTEANAELRRVMLEYYGYERYLAESGATPVHRDETGVLWRIELPGDEAVVTVEVVNSTPEPDGSHRVYWLRVPPRTRTAREGVAWTFGLTAEEYQPALQT
ncbi:hypothetical protein GXW83_26365 [Streptacidiphilus sp. PB12-B1b]|uniref:DUF6745 domain-containing protein n=1 Tax=Streptacidiphilus sp. PB12-B1b TaxID=2705012 RepID=UPI0015FE65B5|nr:hypothetical protein [Streptacidiphilus sp. PB12-B1b]QMU78707.1 hypothetical protein GXW83_26365 [Streptacidiphilus sp. PB12-B1b]